MDFLKSIKGGGAFGSAGVESLGGGGGGGGGVRPPPKSTPECIIKFDNPIKENQLILEKVTIFFMKSKNIIFVYFYCLYKNSCYVQKIVYLIVYLKFNVRS